VILDASVIVAIALDEPERGAFFDKIAGAPTVSIPAPSVVEAGIVLSSRGSRDTRESLLALLAAADATVIEFGDIHWPMAVSAWQRYGKGRHPAGLNFGDCLTYATASVAGQPLLAKGDDFAKTDLELA
jgi:ribonuclease VapC